MKFLRILALAALLQVATSALAENWVTVAVNERIGMHINVDLDSIRMGDDGLVYYRSEGGGRLDKAGDCAKRLIYSIRLHYGETITEFPNWRSHGGRVAEGSLESAAFDYACARARGH